MSKRVLVDEELLKAARRVVESWRAEKPATSLYDTLDELGRRVDDHETALLEPRYLVAVLEQAVQKLGLSFAPHFKTELEVRVEHALGVPRDSGVCLRDVVTCDAAHEAARGLSNVYPALQAVVGWAVQSTDPVAREAGRELARFLDGDEPEAPAAG